MIKINSFTHECDEQMSKPIMNYSVIYDNSPKRHECFANALIDEQIILSATNHNKIDDAYIQEIIHGCDNVYPDCVVYFFPKDYIAQAKGIINAFVDKWSKGQDSGVFYSEYGDIYIAMRNTENGLWVLTYDGTTVVAFEKAYEMFEPEIEIQKSFGNKNLRFDKPFVSYNVEESSGEAFFHYFKRQKKVFQFMKDEGVYDSNCGKKK